MTVIEEIAALAQQLRLDTSLVYREIYWALGEERINRLTPTDEQFMEWKRSPDGLKQFWSFANQRLGTELSQDDVLDVWPIVQLSGLLDDSDSLRSVLRYL